MGFDPISLGLEGAGALASLFGMFGGDSESKKYVDQAVQEFIKVHVPDPNEQRLELQRYQSAGQLSPELEHQIKADPSAFQSVVKNVKYQQAQDKALGQLQSLGEDGGLSLSDKANVQDQMIQNANKDKANRDAITDDLARRGQLGSGMGLQAQIAGAQQTGDRDAQMRLHTLGDARDRALQAISGAGSLAGNMQSADYQRQSDQAQAQDRINQFNTQNAQSVQQRNVASQNQAQGTNLKNKQDLMNSNADVANKEQQYNKELLQKQFDNQMDLAKSKAGVYQNAAQQAKQGAQKYGAIGSALGQVGTSIQNQSNWDDWMKTRKLSQ